MSYVFEGPLVGSVLLGGPAGETDSGSMAGRSRRCRLAEVSVVDEVEKDVVGRAEDGHGQLNQSGPTGRLGTAGLADHFLQE